MHIKMPHKFKRLLTEPDDLMAENKYQQPQNYTLKELKMHVSNMNQCADSVTQQNLEKGSKGKQNQQFMAPLHDRIKNKRHALRRLPQINNTVYHNNCNDQHNKPITNNPSKLQNPLFIVNSLFQIMKEDIVLTNKHHQSKQTNKQPSSQIIQPHKIISNKSTNNQFQNLASKSVKISRAPRLINNQLNRLNNHTKLANNRRIYSEQKRRPKMDNSEYQMLTFYKPKAEHESSEKDRTLDSKWEVILESDRRYQMESKFGEKLQMQSQEQQNQFL